MTNLKLTDTQLMLLSQASQREDHLVTTPATLKGGAVKAVISELLIHSLVAETHVARGAPSWRKDEHEQPIGLKLTRAGLEAIGLEPDREASSAGPPSQQGQVRDNGQCGPHPAAAREGSKRALIIALLRREEGASLDDLVQATGWLPHTTRAALTGLRQRGYELARDQGEGGRSVYRIASMPAQSDGTVPPAAAEA